MLEGALRQMSINTRRSRHPRISRFVIGMGYRAKGERLGWLAGVPLGAMGIGC